MTIVADTYDHAIGVDTHLDTHTAVIIDTSNGAKIAETTISTCQEGLAELVAWADHHETGCRIWAIEGCGSYGKSLNRFLTSIGEVAAEVERPGRQRNKSGGKSDSIDAERAGRQMSGTPISRVIQPRSGPERDALEILLVTRRSAVNEAKRCATALHAAILKAPPALAARFNDVGTTNEKLAIARCLRPTQWKTIDARAAAQSMRSLALRHELSTSEAAQLHASMAELVASWRPDLLDVDGVGVVVAATLLCAWSHPGRFANDASFAMFAGTAPIPASSGKTAGTNRLNRGGDRAVNAAIYTIVMCRSRRDPATLAYIARRRAEGKSDRDIRRCLKRAVTRQLFKQLENAP